MKKIGIVTWYSGGYNYGSSLQAFAMQTIINELGYETEFINYTGDKKLFQKIKDMLKKPFLFLFKKKVYLSWLASDEWTQSNLRISNRYRDWDELKAKAQKYDAIVCGSDQIWRHNGDGLIDDFYFLQFVSPEKRISYAPSIARDYIDGRIKDKFQKNIREIMYLSIREENGAKLIKRETGCSAKVVLDPTLLLSSERWSHEMGQEKKVDGKYIFCYLLTKNKKYNKEIYEFSNKININTIAPAIISNDSFSSMPMDCFKFLKFIKNAKFVITDSYHGLLFCLIFKKSFAIYKRFDDFDKQSQNSRIFNVLMKTNLFDRIVGEHNTLYKIYNREINYKKIDKIIEKEQVESKLFLINAINATTNS